MKSSCCLMLMRAQQGCCAQQGAPLQENPGPQPVGLCKNRGLYFFWFFPSLDEVHHQRLKNLDLFSLEKNSFVPLASKYKNVW